jgi:uncharacterized membrane protein
MSLPLALSMSATSTCSSAAPALVSLVAFVALILAPALSAYGRIWEKAAAGLLSLVVLAALVVTGVIIGLMIVYYYPEIVRLFGG